MPNSSIHPKLVHLSDSQIDNLITRYYAGETIADLLGEFNIDCHPPQLYKLLPPIIHSSVECPYCGAAMMSQRVARSAHVEKTMSCSQCRHEDSFRCKCDHCRNGRGVVSSKYSRNDIGIQNRVNGHAVIRHIGLANLTLEQAVSLLSLKRYRGFANFDDKTVSAALDMAAVPFAPKGSYGMALIGKLREAKILSVLNLSELDYFNFVGDESQNEPSVPNLWIIPGSVRTNLIQDIEQCVAQSTWLQHWSDQLPDLVHALAFAECKEFYDYCAKQRSLPASAQRSTSVMLNNLLQDYSVAQCYRIIYAGAQAAADFLVRTSCTSQHAANYMIGACQRWVDRARAENWVVTPFYRNHELPRSMISYVLYDDFLKTGDDGFNVSIAKITLPKKM